MVRQEALGIVTHCLEKLKTAADEMTVAEKAQAEQAQQAETLQPEVDGAVKSTGSGLAAWAMNSMTNIKKATSPRAIQSVSSPATPVPILPVQDTKRQAMETEKNDWDDDGWGEDGGLDDLVLENSPPQRATPFRPIVKKKSADDTFFSDWNEPSSPAVSKVEISPLQKAPSLPIAKKGAPKKGGDESFFSEWEEPSSASLPAASKPKPVTATDQRRLGAKQRLETRKSEKKLVGSMKLTKPKNEPSWDDWDI